MISVPVDRRHHVLAFVALNHVAQFRKYTGEPYVSHLQSVAKLADGKCDFGYEIGLCHDLFEDTDCLKGELYHALVRFGYDSSEANFISDAAIELTDVYTSEKYPDLNRSKRKKLEAERLHKISYAAQTVKYCDLIDNTSSIVEHDKGFARVYLKEKEDILSGMTGGNKAMYNRCINVLNSSKEKLKQYI